MVLDFAALPPEVNSARMYAGAGAGPLMAAGAAYNNLAAELTTAATSHESVITELTSSQWTGVGSAAAAAAAQPYIAWLHQTSAAVQHAGSQAFASAAAYETAFSMTVPPPVVAANRSLLATLVATNFLGINTPAIAATEAHYAEMWVQDATAMYTYAASSLTSGTLTPLTPAASTSNPAAPAVQAAAVGQSAAAAPAQGIIADLQALIAALNTGSFLPEGVQSFAQSVDGLLGTPFIFNQIQQVGVTAAWFVGNTIPTAVSLGHTLAATAVPVATASDVTPLAGGAIIGEGALVNSVSGGGLGGAVSAGMAESSAVGGLSVPASWSTAAPATLASSTAPLEGSGWAVPQEGAGAPVSAMPGMPGAAAAKGAGAMAGPRYGFKPIVMPKQVVV
jgi:PPE-repeat protein